MKRGILCVAALLVLAACGSGQATTETHTAATPTPSTDTLKVVMAGPGGSSGAGAIITNESKSLAATNVTLQATVKDASGNVLATGTQTVSIVHAQETLPVAVNMNVAGQPASADVVADVGSWTSQDGDPTGRITASDITIAPPDDGDWSGYIVTAQLNSTYDRTFENANAAAVCFNATGNIDGAYIVTVPTLPANGSTAAEWTPSSSEMPTRCEVGGWP